MEQALIAGLLISLMGGLGWLSCHYPRFAVRIIIGLLASTLLLHIFIKVYQRGWTNNHTLLQRSVARMTHNSLKTKRVQKIKSAMPKAISKPCDNLHPFDNAADTILLLLEPALAGLLLFSIAFQKHIKKLPPQKPLAKTITKSRHSRSPSPAGKTNK
jgi:hypothetical protein